MLPASKGSKNPLGVPVTVSGWVPLVPPVVVTDTGKVVVVPEAGAAMSAVRLVPLMKVVGTLVPLKLTVAPLTKLVPVKVTVVVCPAAMGLGFRPVSVGVPGRVLKVTAGLDVAVEPPQLLVTVTVYWVFGVRPLKGMGDDAPAWVWVVPPAAVYVTV